MKKCVIFAAGGFNADAVIGSTKNDIVRQCGEGFCIAADGGLDALLCLGVMPDLVIGDMDSLAGVEQLERLEKENSVRVKRLPRKKDDTDMLAAVKEGLGAGCESFEMYGALGGRTDHTIANIQCLYFLLSKGAYGVLHGVGERMELLRNSRLEFTADFCKTGTVFSAFALGNTAHGVTEKGFMYELCDADLTPDFPIGVSNEFIGERAQIEVRDGTVLIFIGDKGI